MTEFYLQSQKTYNGRYMYLSCTQEPVPEENKSIVHWVLTVTGGASPRYDTGPTTITINGQTVYYAAKVSYTEDKFPAAKGSTGDSIEIVHEADGSKSIECSIKTAIYNGVMYESKATWEMDAIPQASTVLATDCYIGSTSVVLVDRKSSQYTHTIGFCTPDLEGFLCADGSLSQDPVQLSATSIPFLVPLHLYNRIPDEKTLECKFICTTYAGQTQIGDPQECRFLASCREEDCIPYVSGEVQDCNNVTVALTGGQDAAVRFFSTIGCEIHTEAKNGATIVHKEVNGVEIPGVNIELSAVETGKFIFTATDSRGYTGRYPAEMNLIPYVKLTALATAKRLGPTSNTVTLTVEGKCFWGNFGAQENTLRVCYVQGEEETELEITPTEDGYIAHGTVEGLSYERSHSLQVVVRDKLMEVPAKASVNPGVPVFDWGEKDFAFHVPVTLEDGSVAVSKRMLLDAIFPIHSIVARYDDTSPAQLFGGVWERLVNPETGEGVFLFSAPEGDELGQFDGDAAVALTVEQIPSHNHGFLDFWSTSIGSANRFAVALNGDGAGLGNKENDRSYTASTGGGTAHNNMPPYVKVAIWRRIE